MTWQNGNACGSSIGIFHAAAVVKTVRCYDMEPSCWENCENLFISCLWGTLAQLHVFRFIHIIVLHEPPSVYEQDLIYLSMLPPICQCLIKFNDVQCNAILNSGMFNWRVASGSMLVIAFIFTSRVPHGVFVMRTYTRSGSDYIQCLLSTEIQIWVFELVGLGKQCRWISRTRVFGNSECLDTAMYWLELGASLIKSRIPFRIFEILCNSTVIRNWIFMYMLWLKCSRHMAQKYLICCSVVTLAKGVYR